MVRGPRHLPLGAAQVASRVESARQRLLRVYGARQPTMAPVCSLCRYYHYDACTCLYASLATMISDGIGVSTRSEMTGSAMAARANVWRQSPGLSGGTWGSQRSQLGSMRAALSVVLRREPVAVSRICCVGEDRHWRPSQVYIQWPRSARSGQRYGPLCTALNLVGIKSLSYPKVLEEPKSAQVDTHSVWGLTYICMTDLSRWNCIEIRSSC